MRELNVRLPPHPPAPARRPWRETFFFLVSFLATFGASLVILDHAAAILS